MSDTPAGDNGNTVDPIGNFKAEVGRKQDNLEKQVKSLVDAQAQLLNQIAQLTQPKQAPAPVAEDDIEDLWYKDPKKASELIAARTEAKINANLNKQQELNNRTAQTLNSLTKDYPELSDETNPLTKRAVEIYMGLSDEEKRSPMAYKVAVKDAASELDVKPVSKRSADDYYSSSGSSNNYQPARSKKSPLAAETIAFAKVMGLNTDDPKVIASLTKRSERKNWNKYE